MAELGFSNLGFINLSIVYCGFAFASMLAGPINRRLGTRMTCIVSGMTYALWIGAFLLPAYKFEKKMKGESTEGSFWMSNGMVIFSSLFTAALLGMGAGPLWVSQAFHLS
jgi:MFS family permease